MIPNRTAASVPQTQSAFTFVVMNFVAIMVFKFRSEVDKLQHLRI
jgi:hypothetical protein